MTRPLGQVSTSWVEPTRGNVVKTKGPNDIDWTHYEYDALGLMVAGWAPVQWGQEATPDVASVTPTVLNVYGVYAEGPELRTSPVVVTSAALVRDTGTTYTGMSASQTTRRSYTFLDGWGRTLEQHSPAADGSGGRTVTATGYNSLGQVEWVSAPFFNAESAQVSSGLVNPVASSLVSYTAYGYDSRGRTVTQALSSLGIPVSTTETAYAGLTTVSMAPNGAATSSTTDILGRLISQTQFSDEDHPESAPITTVYDYGTTATGVEAGFQTVTVTDAEDAETVFTSNLAGQRVSMTDPNSGSSVYGYDGNGQATSVTSEAGTITMGYDVLGRMTSRTSVDPASTTSSSATWTYDPVGHVGALASSSSSTRIDGVDYTVTSGVTYDTWHRPLTSTVTLPTSPLLGDLSGYSYTSEVSYDGLGQVSGTDLPAVGGLPAETISTGYRYNGMAQTLTLSGTGFTTPIVTGVEVDGTGLFQSRSYSNGVTRDITWDTTWRTPETISASFDYLDGETPTTAYLQLDELTRDAVGRVTAIDDSVTSSTQCYIYDGHNRLEAAWTTSDPCGTAPIATDTFWDVDATSYATTWDYSATGRITEIVNLATGGTSTTSTFTYGDLAHPNAVTDVTTGTDTDGFTYDEAGRQVTRTVDGVPTTLTWDVLSSLTETDGAGGHLYYVYDGSGQRVLKVTLDPDPATGPGGAVTAYLGSTEVTDADTSVNHTEDAQLEGTSFVTGTRYYTFGGSTVAVRESSPTTSTLSLLLGDSQGSASVMMQVTLDPATGAMLPATTSDPISRSSYLPYGATRGTDGLEIDHGWLNQTSDGTATDGGTGLIYLNARYYDPMSSRFLSPDPLMNPTDPRTLDPYMYAADNPISFQDASGLCYGLTGQNLIDCATGWSTAKASSIAASRDFYQLVKGIEIGAGYYSGTTQRQLEELDKHSAWKRQRAEYAILIANNVPEDERPTEPSSQSPWTSSTTSTVRHERSFLDNALMGILVGPAFILNDVGVCIGDPSLGTFTQAAIEAATIIATKSRLGLINPASGNSPVATGTANSVPTTIAATDLNAAQLSNLGRYTSKLPVAAEQTVITAGENGVVTFTTRVPGRVPNSYATYTKTVDEAGTTIGYVKTTVAPNGSVVSVKDKLAG